MIHTEADEPALLLWELWRSVGFSVSPSLSLSVSLSPVSGTLYTTTLHIPGKFLSRNCTTSPPETTSSASDDRHNPIRELDRTPCPRRRVAEALTLGAVCLNSALYHAECSDASDRDETEAGGVGRVRCPPIRSNISTRARCPMVRSGTSRTLVPSGLL